MPATAAEHRHGTSSGVRRAIVPFALAAWILLLLAPAVLADDRDPRCADWERNGAPPGIDMAALCPQGPLDVGVDLAQEPLAPYIVALLVIAGVLTVFGFVAMRLVAPKPATKRARAQDWWACASCGARNRPDRGTCYACQATRAEPGASAPAST